MEKLNFMNLKDIPEAKCLMEYIIRKEFDKCDVLTEHKDMRNLIRISMLLGFDDLTHVMKSDYSCETRDNDNINEIFER